MSAALAKPPPPGQPARRCEARLKCRIVCGKTSPPSGGERLLGVDDRRRAVVLLVGQADVEVVELQRVEQALAQPFAEVPAGALVDDLGQHPVRCGGVVFPLRIGLPVEPPAHHPPVARLAVFPEARVHRRVGEAAGVQHDLLHGDRLVAHAAALRAPAGDDVDDSLVEREQAVVDQAPGADTDDCFGRREHAEEGVVADRIEGRALVRRAVAAEAGEAALGGDRDLSALNLVAGHLLLHEAEQLFEPGFIDADLVGRGEAGVVVGHLQSPQLRSLGVSVEIDTFLGRDGTAGHSIRGMPAAVEIRGLVKRYGAIAAVDGVDLTIESGQVYALLGPNGAGKTTLVEILEGYRKRDAGEVRVLVFDPQRQRGELNRRVGIGCSAARQWRD